MPSALFLAALSVSGLPAQNPGDLTNAGLEALMNMEVSSAARKDEKLSQTPSAVYVITQEDIRRSGLTSIPELLRMVPGVDVAQISANMWAVSARGFNGRFANKMLVLIDGRSVFNHLFSGVYWEQNNIPLEDIERIEVIRGPGATMWGANAVNGVINIITKAARETQGLTVSAGGCNAEHGSAFVRYGGQVGSNIYYSADAEYFDRGPFSGITQPAHDQWDSGQGGARLDWKISDRDSLTVQGDIYKSSDQEMYYPAYPSMAVGAPLPDLVDASGGYVRARWEHVFSGQSDIALQFSTGNENRTEEFGNFSVWTPSLDFQHHLALSSRNDLMWGVNLTVYDDRTKSIQPPEPSSFVQLVPAAITDPLAGVFVQDEITILPEHLTMTLGTKVEHDTISGFEIQPSARLLWTLTSRQSLWAAVSRAVATPSDGELNSSILFPIDPAYGIYGLMRGNPHFRAETALDYETGYRYQPSRWMSLDLAAFLCHYSDLTTVSVGAPELEAGPAPIMLAPMQYSNLGTGHTYGLELATNWNLSSRWRLTGNYSWFRYTLDSLPANATPNYMEGNAPAHQVQFRSLWDMGRRVTFDTGIYYVSALTGIGVPGYVRSDARLGWRLNRAAEISLAGQNLLDGRHLEFWGNDYVVSTEPGRAVYLKMTWAF